LLTSVVLSTLNIKNHSWLNKHQQTKPPILWDVRVVSYMWDP
jgi:hypothetical protein